MRHYNASLTLHDCKPSLFKAEGGISEPGSWCLCAALWIRGYGWFRGGGRGKSFRSIMKTLQQKYVLVRVERLWIGFKGGAGALSWHAFLLFSPKHSTRARPAQSTSLLPPGLSVFDRVRLLKPKRISHHMRLFNDLLLLLLLGVF